ncbi:STAS domain-containing protein [Streptomyces sp. NPDC050564]|uniref:STAS domain-containing protein n=1 Tax=Streptomyces sp. NPDC050564 TaxID=3365631 RepID=UPI0037BA04A8
MPLPQPNIFRHDGRKRALITLAGEFDLETVPPVRASLERCLREGIRTIDVDLTPVTFCDCSGLKAFLHASQRITAIGGRCNCTIHQRCWFERSASPTASSFSRSCRSGVCRLHSGTPRPRPLRSSRPGLFRLSLSSRAVWCEGRAASGTVTAASWRRAASPALPNAAPRPGAAAPVGRTGHARPAPPTRPQHLSRQPASGAGRGRGCIRRSHRPCREHPRGTAACPPRGRQDQDPEAPSGELRHALRQYREITQRLLRI